MNIAEGHRMKVLEAEVASLKSQVADLARRLDDSSKAHRLLADAVFPAKSKKAEAA